MAAYTVVKIENFSTITTDINTFLSSVSAAETIRNAAWALLDPDDPIINLKPAWDTFKASVYSAFITFQANKEANHQVLFNYYNSYIEGGTRWINT